VDSPLKRRRIYALLVGGFLAGIAFAVSAVVCYEVARHVGHTLTVKTDVVGWPIFYAFDPFRYHDYYYLGVVVFPVLGLAGVAVLWWIGRRIRLPLPRRAWWSRTKSECASAEPSVAARGGTGITTRLLMVGAILGLIVAVARGEVGYRVWRDIGLAAVVYAGVVALVAQMIANRRANASAVRRRWVARLNILGASVTPGGIVIASFVSRVTVLADHSVRRFPWFPLWAGVFVVVAVVVTVAVYLARAGDNDDRLERAERRMVFLLAVPVAVFLTVSKGAGDITAFGGFDGGGQQLGTVRLVQNGAFPWRDWVSIHGLLTDTLSWLIGPAIIQNSYWGAIAGIQLFANPLCIIALYYFAYAILGGRWTLLALVVLGYFQPDYVMVFFTFALWPLVLILMFVVLRRRSFRLAVLLGAALVVQAVLGPETAYCIPAAGIAILGCDLFDKDQQISMLRRFVRTAGTFVGGVLAAGVLLIVLLAHHAVGDFISYYTTFAIDHTLTGGLPMQPLVGSFRIAVAAPLAAMFIASAFIAVKAWLRRRFDALDWLLVATTILTILYYPKFLDRADGHIQEVFAACIPFFIIIAAEFLRYAENLAARPLRFLFSLVRLPQLSNTVGFFLVVGMLTQVGAQFSQYVEGTPVGFRQTVANQPWSAAMGYAAPTAFDPGLISDMDTFLSRYMQPGGQIFDMTDEPGFLYWLLPYMPSTPYYHISTAIRQVVQQNLIADLEKARPLFIVFAQGEVGQPSWDGITNMVRHYDVSRYVLDNYRPFADVHGQVLYVRDDATVPEPQSLGLKLVWPLVTQDLYFRSPGCDWNHTGDYLDVAPQGESAAPVGVVHDSPTALTLTPPAGHKWSDYRWIEVDAASQFTAAQFQIADSGPVAGEVRSISFVTSDISPHQYRVPIGSCSQWYGYGSAPLHVTMTTPQQVASISLLP
jgi:hypothetical protein